MDPFGECVNPNNPHGIDPFLDLGEVVEFEGGEGWRVVFDGVHSPPWTRILVPPLSVSLLEGRCIARKRGSLDRGVLETS